MRSQSYGDKQREAQRRKQQELKEKAQHPKTSEKDEAHPADTANPHSGPQQNEKDAEPSA
jgi:hypothetical protein